MSIHCNANEPAATPADAPPELVSRAPQEGAVLSLARDVTLIGSGPSVRLRLRSAAVSRCHAAIVVDNRGVFLRDLSRRANTLVNGLPHVEAQLHPGDMLTIGSFVFEVRCARVTRPGRTNPPHGQGGAVLGPDDGRATPLAGKTLLIGRTENCDLRLDGADVSSAHALVFDLNGRHHIRDLNSRTGTLVNGAPVRQAPLNAGDRIRVGAHELRYAAPQEPDAPAPAHQPDEAAPAPAEAVSTDVDPAFAPAPEEEPKAVARLSLEGLSATYDGHPHAVTVRTDPPALEGAVITYNGSTDPPTNAGRYRVEATLEHPDFAAEPVAGVLNVARAAQTITFAPLPDYQLGDQPFTLAATASSGLRVSFATAGALRCVGTRATIVAAGKAWVTATQSGSANYDPASQTVVIDVRPAPEAPAQDQPVPTPANHTQPAPVWKRDTAAPATPPAAAPPPAAHADVVGNTAAIDQAAAEEPEADAEPSNEPAPVPIDPLSTDSMLRLLPSIFGVGSFEQEVRSLQGEQGGQSTPAPIPPHGAEATKTSVPPPADSSKLRRRR